MQGLFNGVIAAIAFPVLVVCSGLPSMAESPIVRIEEDWELHIDRPDREPQISTRMFPHGSQSLLVFQLDLNHGSIPEIVPGGYQLHTDIGDKPLNNKRSLKGKNLKHPAETLSWTQVIQCSDKGLYYGVLNGKSHSWGAWGGATSFIYVTYKDASCADLAAYDPHQSEENSGFRTPADQAGELRLRKVRIFRQDEPAEELIPSSFAQR